MNTTIRESDNRNLSDVADFLEERVKCLQEALRIERLARMEAERRVVELEALQNGEDLEDDEPHRDEFDSGIPKPGM
ncbi:MAG TPA: hypothetical protein VLG74_02865 [Blastocatellia bacterium]|nr:hypothetical protein [Blastocatellia bacterium]